MYDPAVALQVSATVSRTPSQALGPLIVTHLVTTFDLKFARLLTERDMYLHAHTRSLVAPHLLEDITNRAQALLATPPSQPFTELIAGAPVLLLSIGDDQRTRAVLCCGRKHSGDCYTRQDRLLLDALGHQLAVRLQFQARVEEQRKLLHVTEASAPCVKPVTRSELRILRLLALGLGNKEMAEQLARDPGTIEKHLS